MLQIRVGVQLASLRLPFKQGLLTAARMGAEAVEIDGRSELKADELSRTGVRQVRKMLEDLNLRVSAVTYRTRRGYQVADDLDRRVPDVLAGVDLGKDGQQNWFRNFLDNDEVQQAVARLKGLAIVVEPETGVQIAIMAQTPFNMLRTEVDLFENLGIRLEPNQRPIRFGRFAFVLLLELALFEKGFDELAVAKAANQELLRERVHRLGADAV